MKTSRKKAKIAQRACFERVTATLAWAGVEGIYTQTVTVVPRDKVTAQPQHDSNYGQSIMRSQRQCESAWSFRLSVIFYLVGW